MRSADALDGLLLGAADKDMAAAAAAAAFMPEEATVEDTAADMMATRG